LSANADEAGEMMPTGRMGIMRSDGRDRRPNVGSVSESLTAYTERTRVQLDIRVGFVGVSDDSSSEEFDDDVNLQPDVAYQIEAQLANMDSEEEEQR
ncbi:MAG: hypothetical protein MHM6MM_002473, partial [Cercozoa sp. M6MM]